MVGSSHDDTLTGLELANDTINGGFGDDTIYGLGGDDYIRGYFGADVIYSGDGNDEIFDGDGADTIYAGAGDDLVHLLRDYDNDLVYAGADAVTDVSLNDTIQIGDGNGEYNAVGNSDFISERVDSRESGIIIDLQAETVTWQTGAVDTIVGFEHVIGSYTGFDYIYGDDEANIIDAIAGGSYLQGYRGDDTLAGFTSQNDTVSYAEVTTTALNVNLDYNATTTATIGAETDSLRYIDHVVGTNYVGGAGDTIVGDEIGNRIYGQDGDDYINGGAGNDIIDVRVELGEILAKDQTLVYSAATDTVYKVVTTQETWTDALAIASSTILAGSGDGGYTASDVAGRLVTFESGREARIVHSLTTTMIYWAGAAYDAVDDAWEWVGGPNDGMAFYANGDYIDGAIEAFYSDTSTSNSLMEPDGRAGQIYLSIGTAGYWNTADNVGEANSPTTPYTGGRGYIIEWDASAFANDGTNNDNTLLGGTGDDQIYAAGGNDTLNGGSGMDTLLGGAGSDTVTGGTEDDIIYISSDGVADTYDGGADTDTISAEQATAGVEINLDNVGVQTITDIGGGTTNIGADVISNFENIRGSNYGDILSGSAVGNAIYGNDGNDTIYGLDGNDYLEDGFGADTLYGGNGDDRIRIWDDNDTDYIYASFNGTDSDTGDALYFSKFSGDIIVNLAAGTVTSAKGYVDYVDGFVNVFMDDDSDADTVYGNAAINIITGADGNDYINGGAGNDTLYGSDWDSATGFSVDPGYVGTSAEANWLDYLNEGGTGAVDVTLNGSSAGTAIDTYGDTDTVYYFRHVRGTNLDDNIVADANNNELRGYDGADTIDAGNGDNIVYGGIDNDIITAGTGDDELYGDEGDDTITAGAGRDTIEGNDGNDLIYGGDEQDEIYGGADNDTLYGDAGADQLFLEHESTVARVELYLIVQPFENGVSAIRIYDDLQDMLFLRHGNEPTFGPGTSAPCTAHIGAGDLVLVF